MSQSDLARLMGVQQSNLSRLERGLQGVTIDTLGLYARILGVGVEELMRERADPGAAQRNGQADPRLKIHGDPGAAPGLKELSADVGLCATLAITADEWRQLAAIPLPHTVTKAGYSRC